MSHFTVLVIGENIDEKLAPYSEEMQVEPYIDTPREEVEKKYTEIRKEAVMSSFKRFQMHLEGYRGKTRIPKYLQKYTREMSLSEFANEFYGQKLDENGNLLTTYNPNSKWDWFQIGGRWAGSLLVKDDTNRIRGNPSLLMDEFEYKSNEVDSARFDDIDWEKMQHDPEAEKKLRDFWKIAVNKDPNNKERMEKFIFYSPQYYLDMYKTEDEYVRRLTLFSTYAVITDDGIWHGKGDMGWFGMSSESNDEAADWDNEYWERFLTNLNPDTLITILDCHI